MKWLILPDICLRNRQKMVSHTLGLWLSYIEYEPDIYLMVGIKLLLCLLFNFLIFVKYCGLQYCCWQFIMGIILTRHLSISYPSSISPTSTTTTHTSTTILSPAANRIMCVSSPIMLPWILVSTSPHVFKFHKWEIWFWICKLIILKDVVLSYQVYYSRHY